MTNRDDIRLSTLEILLVSILWGILLGLLTLCFYRPVIVLFGGSLSHEAGGIISRGLFCGLLSLIGLFPMVGIFRNRTDFLARVLVGPLIALGAFFAFLCGGVCRWGSPPSIAWSLGGLYMVYIMSLSLVALWIVAKRFKDATR